MQSWPAPDVPALPGRGPQLRLYDSADRQIRPVTAGETATMYVCGITPYDATHLGHAATYLAFDLVHRVWLDSGHKVHYVQNITDVDDPLFERAQRDGVDWRELADRETDLFREDMAALRVLPPHDYVAATEAIGEVVELVEKMLASGAAYVVDDPDYPDVYFRADATLQFGYESGYDRDTMLRLFTERGGDPDRSGKNDELDALMWRAERPGEPSWPSPFGPGRPGWHVECAAIALSRIGTGLDIQGGGSDLDLPAPRVLRRARRIRNGGAAIRPPLRARRDDRLGRAQDEQEPRQPRPGVAAACGGRRTGGHPARTARRALSRRPVVERSGARRGKRAASAVAGGDDAARGARRDRRRGPRAPVPGRRPRHPESACRTGWLGHGRPRVRRPRHRSRPRRWRPPSTRCSASSCSDDARAHRFSRSCGRPQRSRFRRRGGDRGGMATLARSDRGHRRHAGSCR